MLSLGIRAGSGREMLFTDVSIGPEYLILEWFEMVLTQEMKSENKT